MSRNPFVYSKPVKNEEFYNRKEELAAAIGFIRSFQSFSVIGERRIGKTSFLMHLISEEVLKEHSVDSREYIAVYFDMSSLHNITKNTFIKAIAERTEEMIGYGGQSTDIFKDFKALVEKLASENKNVIIALDEFELIEPILEDISHWLRFILQNENVMAITATQKTLGELNPKSAASPLFNFFSSLTLGLFSREETENMIKDAFRIEGRDLEDEKVSLLADLSGGNPFLIQLLGFHYYNKEMTRNEFENEMLYQTRDLFEGYWRHLSEKEKKFLFTIETSVDDRIGHNLEKRGFVIREGAKWKIFSGLFEKFLSTKAEDKEKEKEDKKLVEIASENDLCFILMPFVDKNLQVVYEDFVKSAMEEHFNLRCQRADDIFGANVIVEDIREKIRTAKVIIAELTGRNANVLYEVGLCHGIERDVVCLTQSIEDIPFDLRHRRVIIYEYSPRGCKKLEKDLIDNIKAVLDGGK